MISCVPVHSQKHFLLKIRLVYSLILVRYFLIGHDVQLWVVSRDVHTRLATLSSPTCYVRVLQVTRDCLSSLTVSNQSQETRLLP